MPLIKIINRDKNIFVGIWNISEDLSDLQNLANVQLRTESEQISHPAKRKEFLASRLVLEQVCSEMKLFEIDIYKSKHGKPFFAKSNWHFSISHTEKYAVCAIHKEKPIGVDTEKIQPKFNIISQKFLTDQELAICNSDIEKIALRWCIKEAGYKWNGEKGLNFKTEILIDEYLENVEVKGSSNKIYFENIDDSHFWVIVY